MVCPVVAIRFGIALTLFASRSRHAEAVRPVEPAWGSPKEAFPNVTQPHLFAADNDLQRISVGHAPTVSVADLRLESSKKPSAVDLRQTVVILGVGSLILLFSQCLCWLVASNFAQTHQHQEHDRDRRLLTWAFLLWSFVVAAHGTVRISLPLAKTAAPQLSHQRLPRGDGVLAIEVASMAAMSIGSLCAAIFGRSLVHEKQRSVLVHVAFACGVLALVDVIPMSATADVIVGTFVQTLLGILLGWTSIFRIIVLKVTPKQSYVTNCLCLACATMLGSSVGFMLTTLATKFYDNVGHTFKPLLLAMPAIAVACLWIGVMLAVQAVIPEDLGYMILTKKTSDNFDKTSRNDVDGCVVQSPGFDELSFTAKKVVWVMAALVGGQRAIIAACIRCTAVTMFESQLSLSALDIRLTLGVFSLLGAVVMIGLNALRQGSHLVDIALIRNATCACLLLTMLTLMSPFQDKGGSFDLGFVVATEMLVQRLWYFALIFLAVHVVSGIVDGWALTYASPNSWFSVENLVVVDQFLQELAIRTVALLSAASIFATCSDGAYSAAQLCMVCVFCGQAWAAWRLASGY